MVGLEVRVLLLEKNDSFFWRYSEDLYNSPCSRWQYNPIALRGRDCSPDYICGDHVLEHGVSSGVEVCWINPRICGRGGVLCFISYIVRSSNVLYLQHLACRIVSVATSSGWTGGYLGVYLGVYPYICKRKRESFGGLGSLGVGEMTASLALG